MGMFTEDQLHYIMPNAKEKVKIYCPLLNQWMDEYNIITVAREAAFLSQIAHESGELRWTVEGWGPTADQMLYEPPSEKAKRLGNTNKGDGKKFCGRGLIQITGRANYTALAEGTGLDCVNHPELLREPTNAVRASCWWWATNGLNQIADGGDIRKITRAVNGGYNGLAQRESFFIRAKEILSKIDFGNVVSGGDSVNV